MDLTKGDISGAQKALWYAVTFFSLEPEIQIEKMGPTENWFCKEKKKNIGCNYLHGMRLVYFEYFGSVIDDTEDDEFNHFQDIWELLETMFDDNRLWSIDALVHAEEWQNIRVMSRKALDILGLHPHPLRKPLWFPDVIDDQYFL
ncbi:hypothetical protein DENIS_1932 [Desulfonema ishimotonii]|uniref:Uncharacterized protein n=1 Tax=Desulfonema ishimotonii TaxID=45657 RepID=A0A401FVH0_9BACT|nr:hypothetical protein [Desulfonema ishimotonii]GBC60972.1 hypothetical protein DENIS_1932 [Desulfonema ishimotonii]